MGFTGFGVLLLVIVGASIYFLIKIIRKPESESMDNRLAPVSAADALKQRYIQGEIDQKTYLKMLRELSDKG